MKQTIQIQYEVLEDYSQLPTQEVELIHKAYEAANNAYSPYSKFNVGATLLLSNNQLISGNNQENCAYPSGLCAERVALFYANANFKEASIKTMVIVSKGNLIKKESVITPCGSCRQVILESEKRQSTPIRIILVSENKSVFIFNSIQDLLPFGFGVE